MEHFFRKIFFIIPFYPLILIYRLIYIIIYYFFITLFFLTILIYFIFPIKKKLDQLYLFIFYSSQLLNKLITKKKIEIIDERKIIDNNFNTIKKELIEKKIVIYTSIKSIDKLMFLFLFLNKAKPLFFFKKKIKNYFLKLIINYIRKKQNDFLIDKLETIRIVLSDSLPDDKIFQKKNKKKTLYGFFTQKLNSDLAFIVKK